MLITSSNNGIYEKVVRSKTGQLFRVYFTVVNDAGVLRGRVLSMEPILGLTTTNLSGTVTSSHSCHAVFLPASVEADITKATVRFFETYDSGIVSPLDFFMSQPTRAPSFI
jgi:hypothetical protein